MAEQETLLILEDDPGIAGLMSRRLDRAGFRTVTAGESAAARRALVSAPVELILLDQNLPGAQSGIDWYREIREAGYDIPAVLITATPPPSLLVEAMRLGVRDFLSKGGDFLDFLVPSARRVLDQVRTERQLVESRARAEEAEARRIELEREVAQRVKAEEKLLLADRRKDQFLAMLGHELRNPIAAIDLAAQLLQQSGPAVDSAWVGDLLRRQLKQVGRLLDDLLDVSRIGRGKIVLRREPHDLAEILLEVESTFRPVIEQAGHRFEVIRPESRLPIYADAARLTQAISNLLTNAAKYTPTGGCVTLSARREGEEAVVLVTDDGIGIDPEQLPHLFEPFYQVEAPEGSQKEGLGIGLTLVHQLVRMHSGTTTARSDGLGTGSEFVLRLPLSEIGSERTSPERDGPEAVVPLEILVVDDQVELADLFARLLAFMGHRVRTANDAKTALESVRLLTPDLVFSDIGMPLMNGHELARRLRDLPEGGRMVLVAVTGYGQESDRERAREAGFDHHLRKPVAMDELTALLASVSERRGRVAPVG